MVRFALPLVLSLALAPYQCQKSNDPSMAREETPGDALWALADELGAQGEVAARRATLAYLVKHYPSSRFAAAARDALAAEGAGASPAR